MKCNEVVPDCLALFLGPTRLSLPTRKKGALGLFAPLILGCHDGLWSENSFAEYFMSGQLLVPAKDETVSPPV